MADQDIPPHLTEPIKVELSDQTPTNTSFTNPTNPPTTTTTTGASSVSDANPHPNPPLSKNAQKKLLKKQAWEEGRPARKAIRREKDKEKKQRRREREKAAVQQTLAGEVDATDGGGDNNTTSAQQGLSNTATTAGGAGAPRKQRRDPRKTTQVPVTIIFDCSYDELMTENEIMSLGAQITRCYSDNKNALYRAHLAVSSYGGRMKERYEGLLRSQHVHWKYIRFCEEGFAEVAQMAKKWMSEEGTGGVVAGALAGVAGKSDESAGVDVSVEPTRQKQEDAQPHDNDKPGHPGEIVYLSSDSPHTLTHLSPYSTYIIGGLVDRNRHKGVCYKSALDAGIKTAKLPIGEFMQMSSRQVLATNHVNEIMINWLEEGDWGSAFDRVIPKRKGGVLKNKFGKEMKGKSDDGDDAVEEEDEDDDEVHDDDEEAAASSLKNSNGEDADMEDDEPVTAEDQVDVAGKEGHPNQQANLKRKVVDGSEETDDVAKRTRTDMP